MAFALRHQTPLTLMMADVDHFKRVNDEHGHQIGDATLREVAKRLSAALRGEDVIARYGGEEFAVLCRGTAEDQASVLADRLRRAVMHQSSLPDNGSAPVTISIGIAVAPAMGLGNTSELVGAADAALYEAKRQGRNRSVVFTPQGQMRRLAK